MSRVVRLFLVAYCLFFAATIGAFLYEHGGLHGEMDGFEWPLQTPRDNIDDILFNYWLFDTSLATEPLIVKVYFLLNFPAETGAKLLCSALSVLAPFKQPVPLGFSAISYPVAFTLLLAPLQWYLAGYLLSRALYRFGASPAWTLPPPRALEASRDR